MESRRRTKIRTIVETLVDEIVAGRYRPPATFPSVARIVRRFGVAHLTAVKVHDELKKMDLVRSRQGSGTFVSPKVRGSLGLIVPAWRSSDFFPALCGEISAVCQNEGRTLLFADTSNIPVKDMSSRLKAIGESFVNQGVAGVLFHPVDFMNNAEKLNDEVIGIFRSADIPVVLLDCDIVNPPAESGLDVIGIDNVSAGWRLGKHVLSRGAKKILYVSVFPEVSPNVQSRYAGLLSAVKTKRGVSLAKYRLAAEKGTSELRAELAAAKMQAVVCSSDKVAAIVMKELSSLGLKVPDDVLVTGVNDISLASVLSPALTTVRQPCADIAKVAFETLERRRVNRSAPAVRIFLPAPIVERESTGKIR